MILNFCFTERNIEIQCVKCQEMGLHSVAFVLHKGKQFTYACDIEFFMDYSESEVMKKLFFPQKPFVWLSVYYHAVMKTQMDTHGKGSRTGCRLMKHKLPNHDTIVT